MQPHLEEVALFMDGASNFIILLVAIVTGPSQMPQTGHIGTEGSGMFGVSSTTEANDQCSFYCTPAGRQKWGSGLNMAGRSLCRTPG